MKKLSIVLMALVALTGCSSTTSAKEDIQMLQSKFQTVYKVDGWDYITFDSTNVYHITVTSDGKIDTKIKIK